MIRISKRQQQQPREAQRSPQTAPGSRTTNLGHLLHTLARLLRGEPHRLAQLFPALVLSLMRRNPATREGAIAGILAGVATVAAITLTHTSIGKLFPALPSAIRDLNIGIVALVVNVAVLLVVSALTRHAPRHALAPGE